MTDPENIQQLSSNSTPGASLRDDASRARVFVTGLRRYKLIAGIILLVGAVGGVVTENVVQNMLMTYLPEYFADSTSVILKNQRENFAELRVALQKIDSSVSGAQGKAALAALQSGVNAALEQNQRLTRAMQRLQEKNEKLRTLSGLSAKRTVEEVVIKKGQSAEVGGNTTVTLFNDIYGSSAGITVVRGDNSSEKISLRIGEDFEFRSEEGRNCRMVLVDVVSKEARFSLSCVPEKGSLRVPV